MRLTKSMFAMSLLALLSGCDNKPPEGRVSYVGPKPAAAPVGQVTNQERPVTVPFDKVTLLVPAEVHITVGKPASLTLHFDEKLLPDIRTAVVSGILLISTTRRFVNPPPLQIDIVTPTLTGATIGKKGSMKIEGISCDRFDGVVGIEGFIKAAGICNTSTSVINGTGEIDFHDLKCNMSDVTISGAGRVVVNASRRLNATISGSGTARYIGHPKVNKVIVGTGTVAPF